MIILGKTTAGLVVPVQVDANGVIQVGGNVIETSHALLDGSIHSDTVNDAPVLGDLIVGVDVGSGVIKWKRKARGTTGQVPTVQADGTIAYQTPDAGGYTEGARAYHSANQSINNNTFTALALDSERYDTNTIHDTVTNNSRLTCKTAGKYFITGHISFAANVTGRRVGAIIINNTTYIALQQFQAITVAGSGTILSLSTVYSLAVNDYLELQAYQDSGGALNVVAVGNYSPEFAMQRIG